MATNSTISNQQYQRIAEWIENVDGWIKTLKRRQADVGEKIKQLALKIKEVPHNVDHNYEMIIELKDKSEELRQEINALKLIQIVSLKREQEKCQNPTSK